MPRLLLVEDDVDALEMLELLLQSAGYAIATAPSRAEAVHLLEREAFDLVMADFVLDPSRTDESTAVLRKLVELAHPAPVGVITGWPLHHEQVDHALAFVLTKPCSRERLLGGIAAALHLPAVTEPQAALVRGYFAALAAGDLAALGALCRDDVVYELPGTDPQFSRRVTGRADLLAFTAQTFEAFRAPAFAITALRPLPEGVMAEYVGSWAEGTARREVPGAVMFELVDGMIARIAVRLDPDLLR